MRPSWACESDLSFDLLLAGDLPEADEQRLRAHLDACRACAIRWAEIETERAAFELLRPSLDPIRRRRLSAWWRSPWLPATAAIAVAAALLLLVLPDGPPADVPATGTRSKGGDLFRLFIRHGHMTRLAGDAEVVYPGDRLQVLYSSARPGFVAVLSRDGAGVASVYFPDAGETAWPAPAGQDLLLPRSTILDHTTGRELVYSLFCSTAIELAPLRAELAAGRPLRAPAGCTVDTVQLDKFPVAGGER